MSTKTINLSLPAELLKAIDEQASREYLTRSDFMREAAVSRLQTSQTLKDLDELFNKTNKIGKMMGITSEQQVYDIINQAD